MTALGTLGPGGGTWGRVPLKAGRSTAKITGEGLVVRFAPVKGITPARVLNRPIYLPAALGTFTVDETALHNEYDTLSAGHFSMPAMGPPAARQFRTGQMESIIVDFDAPYLVATGQDPYELRTRLYEVLRARKAVHMLVTFNPSMQQPYAEFDGYVTFRDVSKEVRIGERESRYLTISFSEWRDPSVQRRSSSPAGGHSSRKHGKQLPTTEILGPSDTLASLSGAFYGTYRYWRDIRDANGIPVRFGMKTPLVTLPGRWKVGAKVKIPDVTTKMGPRGPDVAGRGPRGG